MAANAGWWGFRLRVPPGYVPKPISLVERLAVGFVLAAILATACLAALVVWPGNPEISYRIWAPLWLTVLPVLLCLATPRILLEQSGVAAWMVLAREKGDVSRADAWLALLCVIALILAWFRSLGSIQFALDVALADSAAALLFLILQERITIHWKRWGVPIPDWLRRNLEDEERKNVREQDRGDTPAPSDAVIPPDSGAKPIYTLNVSAGTSYPVGIQIPDDVLECLRKLNTDAHGTLYQSEPQAVVLMDRPPVEHAGRQEILRLCAQILSVARKHQLPPTACANMVLAFVQEAISYKFDKESTGDLQGGPYPEYGRFAVETLHDQVGDCECTSLLCASLLSYLGFRVALLWVAVDSTTANHVAVGLEATPDMPMEGLDFVSAKDDSGKLYLYGETALDGSTSPFGCFTDWDSIKVEKITALDSPRAAM
jgi:hypothetical protein